MENDSVKLVIPKWLHVLNVLLLLVGMLSTVLIFIVLVRQALAEAFTVQLFFQLLDCFIVMLAVCAAEYYYVQKYQKNAHLSFKLYCGLLALTYVSAMVMSITTSWIFGCLNAISLIALLLIFFTKDLGKKKSYALTGVVIGSTVVTIVVFLLSGIESTIMQDALNVIKVVLAAIFGITVFAKYQDKKQRNTK